MVNLILTERKSAVLTPSSLACLSKTATINLTSGCAHNCVYCYTKGYSVFPGESTVKLYSNTAEKLAGELKRKRALPQSVYFSPSSDLFQPVPEVLEMGFHVVEMLLDRGIAVAFLTKGTIPEKFFDLFAKHPGMIQARIGLITTENSILSQFEPDAASVTQRLQQAKRFVTMGIPISMRIDPIIPGVTDDEETLCTLCHHITETGVREIAASILFLRSAITASLKRTLTETKKIQTIMDQFQTCKRLPIHAEHSVVNALPLEVRQKIFDRLKKYADQHGLQLHLCACKNPDLASSSCLIAGKWNEPSLPMLF